MAETAVLPGTAPTLATFFGEVANFPEGVLSGAHNSSVTTITLTAAVLAAWPTTGAVVIDSEVIHYTGVSGSTLTGCTRGAQGTTAASHNDASKVIPALTAKHFNLVLAELLIIGRALALTAREDVTGATTVNFSAAAWNRYHRLTGNTTYTLSNPVTRASYTLILEQDVTGSRTITFATTIKWQGGTTPTWSTTAGKKDVVNLIYDGTDWLGVASIGH